MIDDHSHGPKRGYENPNALSSPMGSDVFLLKTLSFGLWRKTSCDAASLDEAGQSVGLHC